MLGTVGLPGLCAADEGMGLPAGLLGLLPRRVRVLAQGFQLRLTGGGEGFLRRMGMFPGAADRTGLAVPELLRQDPGLLAQKGAVGLLVAAPQLLKPEIPLPKQGLRFPEPGAERHALFQKPHKGFLQHSLGNADTLVLHDTHLDKFIKTVDLATYTLCFANK